MAGGPVAATRIIAVSSAGPAREAVAMGRVDADASGGGACAQG